MREGFAAGGFAARRKTPSSRQRGVDASVGATLAVAPDAVPRCSDVQIVEIIYQQGIRQRVGEKVQNLVDEGQFLGQFRPLYAHRPH
mgnify:CR=1 FL=1